MSTRAFRRGTAWPTEGAEARVEHSGRRTRFSDLTEPRPGPGETSEQGARGLTNPAPDGPEIVDTQRPGTEERAHNDPSRSSDGDGGTERRDSDANREGEVRDDPLRGPTVIYGLDVAALSAVGLGEGEIVLMLSLKTGKRVRDGPDHDKAMLDLMKSIKFPQLASVPTDEDLGHYFDQVTRFVKAKGDVGVNASDAHVISRWEK